MRGIAWDMFKHLIKCQFYPVGYLEELWSQWLFYRQGRDVSVQDYTSQFRRRALVLGIDEQDLEVVRKYISGLQPQYREDFKIWPAYTFDDACRMASAWERKAKLNVVSRTRGQSKDSKQSTPSSPSTQPKSEASKRNTRGTSRYCDHCDRDGHTNEGCWIIHPELKPKGQGWRKPKTALATASKGEPETIELEQLQEADPTLALMTCGDASNKEKEALFILNIQVKQEMVKAIFDPASQRNLVSETLVRRLNLVTTPHPKPYALGWLHVGPNA